MTQFHVIDSNHRRRAQIARELMACGAHAEIYEDFAEFLRVGAVSGVVLANNLDEGYLAGALADREIAVPVVLYSEEPSTSEVVDAMSSGAVDFLEWPLMTKVLDRLIERLETINGRKAAERRKRVEAQARVKCLSPREYEVLALIVQGGSSKSIGEELGISHRTVEIHRANLMSKLKAQSSADAVRIAVYAGVDEASSLEAGKGQPGEELEAA